MHYDRVDKERELSACSFVKTVLMIIVVFYHSIVFWKGGWFSEKPIFTSKFLGELSEWINSFQIYAFTLISGYLFYYLKAEKEQYKLFVPFIKNKIKRLIVPYVFVSLIWAFPIKILFFGSEFKDVFSGFALGTSPAQLWFLLMLFNIFVVSFFLFETFKNRSFLSSVIVFSIYGVSLIIPKFVNNYFQIHTTMKYCMFFFIGMKIRQHGSYYLRRIPLIVYFVLDVILFFAKIMFSKSGMFIIKIFNIGIDLALKIVGSLMIVVFLWKIYDLVETIFKKRFDFLRKHTMVIYLVHQQIIYFCIYMLNGIVNPYLNAIINFLISICVSILISFLIHKSSVISFLFGEKRLD